jgi:hypothetical protein
MRHQQFPTTPGALLGHRKDGRPFYLLAGGSGDGEKTDAPTSTTPADNPADTPPEQAASPPANPPAPNTPPAASSAAAATDEEDVDERSRKTVQAIREDFKAERSRRQAAEKKVNESQTQLDELQATSARQLDAIAKALGLEPDDTPPDPANLTRRLESAQTEARQRADAHRMAEIKLAVYQAAGNHDADVLLDSASFLRRVEGLDPDGADFATQVRDLIAEAVETTPRYKRTPPAPSTPTPAVPKSGGEFSGGQGGGARQWTDDDVARATPDQLQDAINAGLLTHMGVGPARKTR